MIDLLLIDQQTPIIIALIALLIAVVALLRQFKKLKSTQNRIVKAFNKMAPVVSKNQAHAKKPHFLRETNRGDSHADNDSRQEEEPHDNKVEAEEVEEKDEKHEDKDDDEKKLKKGDD